MDADGKRADENDDGQRWNPYASPQVVDPPRNWQAPVIVQRLRGITFGLIGFSGTHILVALWLMFVFSIHLWDRRPAVSQPSPEMTRFVAILAVQLPIQVLVFVAGIRMRQLRNLNFCRTMAIVCCVPGITPLGYLGLPFGILATIMLYRKDVAELFAWSAEWDSLKFVPWEEK